MASSVMRLRLVVRRHGLPEVKIVWPCTSPEDLTVAGLLGEVNEVITLEGTDWGLEDYAVELGDQDGSSFECLHFQQVSKILKHDDQVIIRSLLTDDVRRRRISGREQISSDGKHLLDGVAFGRPWLRAPRGRPAVRLPPRKRPRTIYNLENEGEDDTSGSDTGKQLALREAVPLDGLDRNSVGVRVTFDNEDVYHYPDYDMDDEEDVDNDIDFQMSAENSWTDSDGGKEADEDENEDLSGLGEELRLLKSDNAAAAGEDNSAALLEVDEDAPVLPSITINGGEKLIPLRSAFPLTSLSSIEDEYKRQEGDLRRTHQALSMYNDPRLSFDEMMEEALCGPKVTHSTLQQDLHNAREAKKARPLIEVVEGETHVERPARSASTAPAREVANAAPLVQVLSSPAPAVSTNDLTSSSGSSSDDDLSSDSSDESSSDESALKGRTKGPATGSGKRERSLSSSSDSSDDSSEDSSDDSSEDEKPATTSKSNGPATKKPKVRSVTSSMSKGRTPKPAFFPTKTAEQLDPRLFEGNSSSDSSSDSDSSDSDSSSDSDAPPTKLPIVKAGSKGKDAVPPKASEPVASSSKVAQKEAPPGQGLTKTQKRNKRRRLAMTSKNAENNQAPGTDEIKKSDGQQTNGHAVVGAAADLEARKAALLASIDQEAPEVTTTKPQKAEPITLPAQDTSVDQDVSQKPRMRVDSGAARRMLFSSLGLKNPKTKADEQRIKDGLLEGVKPLKNHRLAEAESKSKPEIQELSSSSSSSDSSGDEDDNSWKNKISYRGVECSQDDVVLSEPPFPFVQRWDPQQQFASRKKRKRKSHAVFDEEYVGDDSMLNNNDDTYNEITMSAPRKRARAESESDSGRIVEVKPTDYKDPLSGSRWSGEDLPVVPANVESLPVLNYGHAKAGMVMTWKQWTLSKTKDWSPNLVNVTALITKVHSDTELTVAMAKRDRRADEREYDPETGKRIYSKFEMPGADEGADTHDDGRREITLIDIVDPRIVRPEPASENAARNPESTRTGPDQDVSMLGSASSQELGSSASIPSGQPPVDLEHNPFSQLLNVSVSAHGSAGVPKDSSMLEKPDAASTPRPAPKRAPTAKVTQPIVVVDDDDSNGKTAPTRVGAKAASSPPQSFQTKQALNGANWKSNNDKVSVSSGSQQNRSRAGSKGPKNSPFIHEPSDEEPDSVIPETLLSQKKTPIQSAPSRRNSSIESSPIPSLDEIFYTANAPRQTKNLPKSSQASQSKAKSQSTRKGRGGMLDLDEDLTFEMTGVKPSNRKLFTNASQPVKREQSAKPRRSSSASSKKRAPFVLPEGSQVIDLEDASESPFARAASAASNRSASSNGSSRGSRKRKRPEEVQHTHNSNATAVHSSPAVNTRQRRNSSTAGAKRGRGRPRKNSISN
ncbi:hypothetical protein CC79DRAFT_1400520 [Sarocladium strictum]